MREGPSRPEGRGSGPGPARHVGGGDLKSLISKTSKTKLRNLPGTMLLGHVAACLYPWPSLSETSPLKNIPSRIPQFWGRSSLRKLRSLYAARHCCSLRPEVAGGLPFTSTRSPGGTQAQCCLQPGAPLGPAWMSSAQTLPGATLAPRAGPRVPFVLTNRSGAHVCKTSRGHFSQYFQCRTFAEGNQ